MAFLDNSGDIILDAVLTDTGRMRLAKGDGTFRIAKFALGDDEINYANYRNTNSTLGAHPSGSAYYDLEILQTPIFEAFTNNTSVLKSRLISIPRTNLLYLPILKLYSSANLSVPSKLFAGTTATDMYVVAVDQDTQGTHEGADPTKWFGTSGNGDVGYAGVGGTPNTGVLAGFKPSEGAWHIEIHQGLDTIEIPPTFTIDADLQETQYIIEIDNRLGSIADALPNSGRVTPVSFVDDDNIASYYISQGTTGYIDAVGTSPANSTIAGPRGTLLKFKIKASTELAISTFLFTKLGGTYTEAALDSRVFYYIDTIVRVTGATTGYRIDVPVRFVKIKTAA